MAMALIVTVAISAADAWPTRWQVNGNGESGAMDLTVDDSGVATGLLFGESIDGFVNGRHLVIRRDAGGRVELWEGWLSSEDSGENQFLAGSISITENGETRVYPWYGTLAAIDPPVPPPVVEETAATGAGGPLSGIWQTLTGERIEIGQDGKRLTVTTSDGASHSGRVTGEASLVVGLRKGCCNGTLESPDVIVLSDGARWERTD